MLEIILKICGLLGGLAAFDYFWGKWYTAEIMRWLRNKFRSQEFFHEKSEGIVPINSSFYVERFPIESEYKIIESDCYETITQSGTLI